MSSAVEMQVSIGKVIKNADAMEVNIRDTPFEPDKKIKPPSSAAPNLIPKVDTFAEPLVVSAPMVYQPGLDASLQSDDEMGPRSRACCCWS